ncbi:hypothetical protein ACHAXR_010518 [Thalassiosira sp. AJA248-18]
MKSCLFSATLVAAIATLTFASSEVKVVVYAGPKKCSNKKIKGDEKPTKIEPDYVAALHFTVTVDESSTGSRESIGKKIESSRDKGIAPSFPVGQGKVVAGLDQGLIGLCKGSSAYIIVPPHLAYGRIGKPEQGVGRDATLRYDVEIIDVQPPVPNDFVKIDANKDWKISKDEAFSYFEGLGQTINLESLWKDEDKDGDGVISWDEFTGPKGSDGPPQKQKHHHQQQQQDTGQVNDVASLFQNIDVDKDGKISKTELGNMFKALGQDMTDEFWTESDPDGDGYVLFEEFIGSNTGAGKGEEL